LALALALERLLIFAVTTNEIKLKTIKMNTGKEILVVDFSLPNTKDQQTLMYKLTFR
jgi:hypothetical protein